MSAHYSRFAESLNKLCVQIVDDSVSKTSGRDLYKAPICGAFVRCVLPARLPICVICLHSLRCYALNCIHI
ncbi:Uncharacterised protein [Neisseria zoodegmatis]|uniref:Uncharacterized protein n=1 Tax=Neisseria zoodegmatis TaxID=326523 RepID=A0AB38DPJ8_9NEIS|nr:Uncharacterised protein [Neisseria zoodegmatis]